MDLLLDARITASQHSSTAPQFGTRSCPSVGTGAGPRLAEEELGLVVGHDKHTRRTAKKNLLKGTRQMPR